jgi:hypothetical protein
MGPRTRAALDLVGATIADLGAGASGERVHAAARGLLGGRLLDAAGSGEVGEEARG